MIIIVHLAPLIGNNHCFQQTLVIILINGGKTKTTQKWRKKCQTIQNENIKCLVKFIYFIHFSSLHWQFKQKFDHENKCGIFFGWHKNTSFVKLVSIMKIAANVEFWWILNSKLLNIWKGGKTRSILADSNQSLSASLTSRRSPTKMARSSFLHCLFTCSIWASGCSSPLLYLGFQIEWIFCRIEYRYFRYFRIGLWLEHKFVMQKS